MKLRCEGTNPCSSCQKRGTPCTRPPVKTSGNPGTPGTPEASSSVVKTSSASQTPAPVQPSQSPAPSSSRNRISDVGSIKFLLNGGMDGFMEDFSFPRKGNTLPKQDTTTKQEVPTSATASSLPVYSSTPAASNPSQQLDNFPDVSMNDWAAIQETFQSFNHGPFDAHYHQWHEPVGEMQPLETIWTVGQDATHTSCDYSTSPEAHNAVSSAVSQALLMTVPKLTQDIKLQHKLNSDIQFLIGPRKIVKFISLYFKLWHPNGPIQHEPTFEPDTVQLPLLISVIFMGAMYAVDERELKVAKNLLDLAELYVFSSEIFAPEAEMRRSLDGTQTPADLESDWAIFQHFQGGYLMSVIQHWAGNRLARKRASENRFSEVVKAARRLGLTKVRHQPADRIHQDLWIRKETRIRTMNVIIALDAALLFFQSYPCKLTLAEMDCDLPCEESLFSSRHPFAEPNFRFTRNLTLKQGMEALFSADGSTPELANIKKTIAPGKSVFTLFDMFMFIHVLTAFLWVRLMLNAPMKQMADYGGGPSEDPFMGKLQRALSCWKDNWTEFCRETPEESRSNMGLMANSYKYFLVGQLLVNKHDLIDPALMLQPGCEEKLERLHQLI
ncbi:hypothetical protein MBLNU457_1250t1 [Dothideomycetes sp. NU457]